MKNYLTDFLKFLEFEKEDSEFLLTAYDKIIADPQTASIWDEAINTYENDINCDFNTLLSLADKVAERLYIHEYTTELLMSLCLTKRLKMEYDARGISEEIFRNTMLDLRYKLEECKLVKGIVGSFVAYWFGGFFDLTRFALGRLQFELTTIGCEFQKGEIYLTSDRKVLAVHIPRTQTPLDVESCDKSFAMAKSFFESEFADFCPFTCHSWLLYPENSRLMSEKSNVYKFMKRFDIIKSGTDKNGEDLWRLFDTDERNPDRLPKDTSLRKAYAEHLKNGGKLGWGFGIFVM